MTTVRPVVAADAGELLPLVRAYCDFYECDPQDPSDDALRALTAALIADPDHEGVQFLARAEDGRAIGFATLFWSWDTTLGGRVGVMNDLFVDPAARGSGAADALVDACRERCRDRGAVRLTWITAPDNIRAQAVYDRLGGRRESWVSYWLDPAS